MPYKGVNSLRDLDIAILKNYDTQTIVLHLVLYTSDLLVVHVVAVSGRTCTQPLSEIANTVSVGCGEVHVPMSGRRRCF